MGSRMESTGFQSCVQVSNEVVEALERDLSHNESDVTPEFEFVEFGKRSIKGKGTMKTYLLKHGNYEAALASRSEGNSSEKDQMAVAEAYQRVKYRSASNRCMMPRSSSDLAAEVSLGEQESVKALLQSENNALKDELARVKSQLAEAKSELNAVQASVSEERTFSSPSRGLFHSPDTGTAPPSEMSDIYVAEWFLRRMPFLPARIIE